MENENMDDGSIFEGRQLVDLPANLKRQFYPTVLLLIALLPAYEYKTRKDVDQPLKSPQTLPDLFRNFVSKLAFLCCTDSGGDPISACAILQQYDDSIEYVFAFNKRSGPELVALKQNMENLLNMFRTSEQWDHTGRDRVLRAVLSINVNRVRCYLKAFERHLAQCIDASKSNEHAEVRSCLQDLQNLTMQSMIKSEKRCDVDVPAAEQLILHLDEVYRSQVFGLVHARVSNEERQQIDECWTELIHVAGRLKTYKQAVDVAHMAFYQWPELLENFTVFMVPSSRPIPQVLNTTILTADKIMGKTTSERKVLDEFKKEYLKLQESDLDNRIACTWKSKPKPIVHAEMQLHHFLEHTERGIDESRFFLNDKFIGTSKPPCRLCSYFFQEYPTDVEVRRSHRNVYLQWRMPDIYVDQGPDAVQQRQRILYKIKARVYEDLIQLWRYKVRDGGMHDSSNYSTTRGLPIPMEDPMLARSTMSTPLTGQISRPVSALSGMREALLRARAVGRPVAPHEPPRASVDVGNLQQLMEAQWSLSGTDLASSGHLESRASHTVTGSVHSTSAVGGSVRSDSELQETTVVPIADSGEKLRAGVVIKEVKLEQPQTRVVVKEEADDDEDGGGVLLFSGRSPRV